MTAPKKALFIQLRRIGDVLMCTPAIRAFKSKYPECHLDFLTELPEVLDNNTHLDSVIFADDTRQFDPVYQYKLIKKIRAARYDLVVDFFANPRSAYYSFLSGAAVRLSYGFGHRKWAYNRTPRKSDQPTYAAQDRLDLLKEIDVPSDGLRLEFYPSDGNRREAEEILRSVSGRSIVTLSPVSRREFNRWPLENYAKLGEILSAELDFAVVVLTGPGEEQVAHDLAEMMAEVEPLVLRIDRLGQLGAIFEHADLHLGNDNGPKHIAVACGARTFTIYGPHSPVSWTYPDFSRHQYIQPADIDNDCRNPNHKCDKNCIRKISIDAVWDKLKQMVVSRSSAQSSPEAG
jgi:heptosyltransferase-3